MITIKVKLQKAKGEDAFMNVAKRMMTVLLCLSLGFCAICVGGCGNMGNNRFFSGVALEYYNDLLEIGFPADYAEELTELHLLHPNWKFVPLDISATNEQYTWRYVISAETENPETNLIYASKTYSDYWHATNSNTYDAGYYQASVDAVEYFMDPRNFFNETDIFQFYDLSSGADIGLQAVEAVLAGSFMEQAVLENGKTYAQNFLDIGTALGVHPVYLAVKAYQEQGADGTSPIISGTCGTTLWNFYKDGREETTGGDEIRLPESANREELLALDGYYNLLNVGAGGKGVFSIYKNAMERAKKGTEQMKSAWGGDASWNTIWKSIWGGAMLLKSSYIDRYQSTVYLQKFNVDGRSGRNFWGQYMQNVAGAMTESRTLYQAFAAIDALDAPCTFQIPVYEGMPEKTSADPARGECSSLAAANEKFSYSVKLSAPLSGSYSNVPFYGSHTVAPQTTLEIDGQAKHDYGVLRLEYSMDGEAWKPLESDRKIELRTFIDSPAQTEHIMVIRGVARYDSTDSSRKSNRYFLCAVLYVTVAEPVVESSAE